MDLNFIVDMYIPVVMAACLVLGFVLKRWCPTDNKWIPTILVAVGAVLGCVANTGITLEYIVAGAVTGLASTGLHQVFKQLIGMDRSASAEDTCIDEDAAEELIRAEMYAAEKEQEEAVDANVAKG